MDKFSELKAAAMAATPGPWAAELNEVWVISNGTADFMLTDIFGDNELSAQQDCANAAFIAAANPAVVLSLLAELEAKDERIGELEAEGKVWASAATKHLERAEEAEKRLATPVRLSCETHPRCRTQHAKDVRAAGFKVMGDEQC